MSQQMVSPSAITSKLTALLRLGLVSKNNVARAITVFKNPEKAMKSGANRMLVQDLLVDIVDRIINNKNLYTVIKQTLVKDPANESNQPIEENVQKERTKTLLRSGLVKKKDIMIARRAVSSNKNLTSMSAVGVYREMMIGMLDSMVKKITGNPILFNAFKKTLGTETVEESFTSPNLESISEFFLDIDGVSLRESNKPTNPGLWSQAKTLAKNRLPYCSTDCSEGWATKWYNENGGDWQSIEEGKNFFTFIDNLEELNRETIHNYTYRARDNAKELELWGKTYGSSDKDRLKIKNRKKGMKTALKKLGHTFIEMAQSHNRRREMEKHLSKPLNNWMKDLDNNEKNDNEHLYGLGGKKVKFRTRKKRALVTGMKEWIEGESQKGVSDKARSIAREIHRKYNTQKQVEMPAETSSTSPKKIESQSRARQNRKNRAIKKANT